MCRCLHPALRYNTCTSLQTVISTPSALCLQVAAEAEVQQLQSSLDSTNELLKKAMDAARSAESDAASAAAAAQQEIDTMKARLAEAAGVLNAKEELREAR